ncbi:MAG TPA: hypothetical protein DEO57_01215 [Phycisphaerales bacterium]|nr:hypothetical protein [Phycisphaerales bacterium]
MVRRVNSSLACFSMLVGTALAAPVTAEPNWFVVTGQDVQIRCGADSSYYSFAVAQEGDLLAVNGEKYNYARVRAMGPVFEKAYGYVKYPTNEDGRFKVEADGSSGTTMGATPILAPNLNTNDLAHSWRQLCILPGGEKLDVIETWNIEQDGLHAVPHTVHRVSLPVIAEGWVNMADLRPATTIETAALNGGETVETTETVETEDTETTVVMGGNESITGEDPVAGGQDDPPVFVLNEVQPSILMQWMEVEEQEAVVENEEVEIVVEERTFLMMIEEAYEGVVLSDLDDEELTCLRDDFILASEEEEDPIRSRYAMMRANQIDVYATLKSQNSVIDGLQNRVERSKSDAVDRDLAISNTGDYEIVGRLGTSGVFNGDERPLLYRIQDPRTNRTLAYVRPESNTMIGDMIGQHVGVMGILEYDPALQVNIINMTRVDLMASNTAYVPVD